MMRSRIWIVLSGWRPIVLKAASSNSCRSSPEMTISFAIEDSKRPLVRMVRGWPARVKSACRQLFVRFSRPAKGRAEHGPGRRLGIDRGRRRGIHPGSVDDPVLGDVGGEARQRGE